MADITFLGVDGSVISLIIDLAVAIATAILAYFTYKSVKISKTTLDSLKNQVDLAQKDFENKQIELEKPQILDQLQEVLNPLSEKIIQELSQIDEKSFLWESRDYRKDTFFYRVKPSSDFYTEMDINTRLGLIIYEINARFPVFKELCQKRYKTYLSISDLFTNVYKDIQTPNINKTISDLISKNNPPHEVYGEEGEYYYDVVPVSDFDEDGFPSMIDEIPLTDFKRTILDIGIATSLMQRIIPHDSYEKMIVSEYSSYEKDMNVLLKVDSFDKFSKSYYSLIEELNSIDTQLKNEIIRIKMEYREKYHLNDKEYWIIFKNTS